MFFYNLSFRKWIHEYLYLRENKVHAVFYEHSFQGLIIGRVKSVTNANNVYIKDISIGEHDALPHIS